ncbi:ribonuclease H-like domain-containing protein [Aquisalimonas asiatica]|uniref:Uncharacterized conserved protein YprB, contains RNaseH-like and TPR domains n=1 Tax=Aquisalimonas asiatica TaxID=406100 RepID=A0A1H8SZZ9_9GAMM|nr:ribonuclease H-like domain-containing protein [Aquisalimonas asiatica]SEO84125.1 Uncharacterized conserved protein YprB, contains RNaseH-like and TPR domains [Aquisalimonas asiatica]
MLKSTFLHLPGIGSRTERRLWNEGIVTWDELEFALRRKDRLLPRSHRDQKLLLTELEATVLAWEKLDLEYFVDRLPRKEQFRIALSLPDRTGFLDIETTGLSPMYHLVTLVGLSQSGRFSYFLRGQEFSDLEETIAGTDCLITFNGTRFDLPFLRWHYPCLRLPPVHIDLMYLARSVGLRGGQKVMEKSIGFHRPQEIQGRGGAEAPALWYEYTYGDLEAGRLLVEYNKYDIKGMQYLLRYTLNNLLAEVPDNVIELPLSSSVLWGEGHARSEKPDNPIQTPQPYVGRRGPKARLEELILESESPLRVVGIDLSGSHNRPTGWSSIVNGVAETELLRTDEEILARTLAAKPGLVSIDSPLSLPAGRTHVGDDDPARNRAGIMRECERILKRRGVNVYPCLIQSMQQLTSRGMRLAQELRRQGVPVIESYPGAAQDIIGLPRKGDSLSMLKRGLREFGVEGDFLKRKVSHDEIDAITSALVGLFFWSGRFEALGNLEEDYLIVPDLRASPDKSPGKRVVGVSGSIAAGKTTVSRHLERREGFSYWRYSAVLSELLREQGVDVNRANLQEFGEYVNREMGQRWLCKQVARRFPKDLDVVVDGLRFPEDRAFFVECFGPNFLHLHVTAPEECRKRRYVEMGYTENDFNEAIQHNVEKKIEELASFADIKVTNIGNEEELFRGLSSRSLGVNRVVSCI